MDSTVLNVLGSDACNARTKAACVLAAAAAQEGYSVLLTETSSSSLRGMVPASLMQEGGLEFFDVPELPRERFVVALADKLDMDSFEELKKTAGHFDLVVASSGKPASKSGPEQVSHTVLVSGCDGLMLEDAVAISEDLEGGSYSVIFAAPDKPPAFHDKVVESSRARLPNAGGETAIMPLLGYKPFMVPQQEENGAALWENAKKFLYSNEIIGNGQAKTGKAPAELATKAVFSAGLAADGQDPSALTYQIPPIGCETPNAAAKTTTVIDGIKARFASRDSEKRQRFESQASALAELMRKEDAQLQEALAAARGVTAERQRARLAVQERIEQEKISIAARIESERSELETRRQARLEALANERSEELRLLESEAEKLAEQLAAAKLQREAKGRSLTEAEELAKQEAEAEELAKQEAEAQEQARQEAAAAEAAEQAALQETEAPAGEPASEPEEGADQAEGAATEADASAPAPEAEAAKAAEEEAEPEAGPQEEIDVEVEAAALEELAASEDIAALDALEGVAAPEGEEREGGPAADSQASGAEGAALDEAQQQEIGSEAGKDSGEPQGQPQPATYAADSGKPPAAGQQPRQGKKPSGKRKLVVEKASAELRKASKGGVKILRSAPQEFVHVVNREELRQVLQLGDPYQISLGLAKRSGHYIPLRVDNQPTPEWFKNLNEGYLRKKFGSKEEHRLPYTIALRSIAVAEKAQTENNFVTEKVAREFAEEVFMDETEIDDEMLGHWFMNTVWLTESYLASGDSLQACLNFVNHLIEALFRAKLTAENSSQLKMMRAVAAFITTKVCEKMPDIGQEELKKDREIADQLLAELPPSLLSSILLDSQGNGGDGDRKNDSEDGDDDDNRGDRRLQETTEAAKEAFGDMVK